MIISPPLRFIGRKNELQALETAYQSEHSELVVIYGRRRLGKTWLLRKFASDKKGILFFSSTERDEVQLRDFSRAVINAGAPGGDVVDTFASWKVAFEQFSRIPEKGKKLLIIDEFPYILQQNPALASILQHTWDHVLQNSNVMIILCGSAVSFIEKEILAEKSPLFGRATRVLRVDPMPFADAQKFVHGYSPADKVATYAIAGGSPLSLSYFNDAVPLGDNVIANTLTSYAPLSELPLQTLQQECREPFNYLQILKVVALGASKPNEIAAKAGIAPTSINRYLEILTDMGFIQKEYSINTGIKETANIQRGLIRLTDNFTGFWFSCVLPNEELINYGAGTQVWQEHIVDHLNEICSFPFEAICRELLMRLNAKGKLPFLCYRVGRLFTKDNTVIDIAAAEINGNGMLLGECKYRNSPMTTGDFYKLVQKAEHLGIRPSAYYLFSKSGFAPALVLDAKNQDVPVELWTLEDIVQALS